MKDIDLLPDGELLKQGFEYKINLLKLAIKEWNNRQQYFYYTYDPTRPNTTKYIDYHMCGKKIRVCKGAPRSGKTVAVVWDKIALELNEHPVYSNMDRFKGPIHGWVIGETYKKVYRTDGLLDKFLKQVPRNRVIDIQNDNKRNNFSIKFDNGSTITFLSQESPEDFTSASIHWAMVDERLKNEETRFQLRTRIIDTDGLLDFTMDSSEEDEWVDDLARSDYGASFMFELYDNSKYLPVDELKRLENELDDINKDKLLYGKFRDRNVSSVFLPAIWSKSNYVEITPTRYEFINGERVRNDKGYLRVFKEPEQGIQYVIGCDTSKGVGRNAHGIIVLEAETGEQVATVLDNKTNFIELDEKIIAPLGKLYNNALVVIENKAHGETVIGKMKLYYSNLFFEQKPDKWNKPIMGNEFGIRTDETNKLQMINQTIMDIETGKLLLHCEKLKKQLDGYVKVLTGEDTQKGEKVLFRGTKIKNDPELDGSDDDLVMGLFMADRAINQWNLLKVIDRKDTGKILKLDEIKRKQQEEIYFIQTNFSETIGSNYNW